MHIILESHKREGCKNSRQFQRSKRNYWDRPIGKIVWLREERRFIFHLEKFDQLNSFGASRKV